MFFYSRLFNPSIRRLYLNRIESNCSNLILRCLSNRSSFNRKSSNRSELLSKSNRNSNKFLYYGLIVVTSMIAIYFYERREKYFNKNNHLNLKLFETKSDSNRSNEIVLESIQKSEPSSPVKPRLFWNFFAEIVERASPAVVFVQAQQHHPFLPIQSNVSSGSGFLVDKTDGIILTNAHVIGNCKKVIIQFSDGRTVEGHVEFVDEYLDLATVKIPSNVIKNLEPLSLGDSKTIRAGEWCLAVGSPFSLSNTVTVGVISSISRAGRDLGIRDIDYIQTDASINVGNSGGPLLNIDGETIGINTLKVGEGISFAIPSDYAKEFLKKCKKYRNQSTNNWWNRRTDIDSKYTEPSAPVPNRRIYLGFTIVTLTPNLIKSNQQQNPNFPTDIQSGVMVYRVVLGAPAHLGGFESGDIITAVNGKNVATADEIYRIIQSDSDQSALEFTVRRGCNDIKIKVSPLLSD
ncbi:serine protease-like protein 1 [Sarcoptes scabiei]|uniref:Serine protease HTRA2, mitochondrial n=2 Tax=Sarcoptes scabiei TaxID=52283 RepID=A0A131ZUG8_SARSC|nr:serine protease-like protein 1 [Sarcoptes scabiei]